jgi:heme/copper-type cytochrome/quinol oxidase subunit 2
MLKLYKFLWISSILLFLTVLLLVYAFLIDRANVQMQNWGIRSEEELRSWFFYVSMGVFLLTNIVLYLLYNTLKRNNRHQPDLTKWRMNTEISTWLLGLAGAINLFYISVMGFFGLLNNSEDLNLNDYTLLLYLGPLAILLLLVLLPLRLSKLRKVGAA